MMAQLLFEALNEKFTPPKETATEAELGATKRHLEDTRGLIEQILPSALRGKKDEKA